MLYNKLFPINPTVDYINKWENKLKNTSKDRYIYNYILSYLANLYIMVDDGFNSKYLRKSIEYYSMVLKDLPPIPPLLSNFSSIDNIDSLISIEDFCLLKVQLATAFRNLSDGNRRENLEKSLEHLTDCFRYRKYLRNSIHIKFLWEYAKTNLSLSEMGLDEDSYLASAFVAYNEIESLIDSDNPYDFIEILKKGDKFGIITLLLQSFIKDSFIEEGAQIYISIGDAYSQRWRKTNNDSFMVKSLQFYEKAISLFDEGVNDTNTVSFANQLIGDVYMEAEQYEKALFYYRQGVITLPAAYSNRQKALLLFKIGKVYFLKFKKSRDPEFINKSIVAFSRARDCIDYQIDPFLLVQVLELLADSYLETKDWNNAYYTLKEAIDISNVIYKIYLFNEDRATYSTNTSQMFHKYAFSASKSGFINEAISVLEAGKNRLINESLIGQISCPDSVSEELWQEFIETATLLRTGWLQTSRNKSVEFYERIRNGMDRFYQLLDKINQLSPNFMGDENIIELLTNFDLKKSAIINAAITDYGSMVFIISSNDHTLKLYHEELPGLTREKLTEMLRKYAKAVHNSFPDESIHDGSAGYDLSIFDVLYELSDVFLLPILHHFSDDIKNIVFVQSYGLSVFPLHLLFTNISGNDKMKMIIDDFNVIFSPSIRQFIVSKNKVKSFSKNNYSLLAVVNPSGTNLKFAALETDFISRFISNKNVRILKGDYARKSIFFESASQFSLWHFACHSQYDWNRPLNSFISLANGERLTLIDLLHSLNEISHARLVTLSTCESGLVDFLKWHNEYIGLPLGFLQIGIPAVISSLWEVDDQATSLLMIKFYWNILIGDMEISEALRNAQLWLRDLDVPDSLISRSEHSLTQSNSRKAYSNPKFWAPFILTGY